MWETFAKQWAAAMTERRFEDAVRLSAVTYSFVSETGDDVRRKQTLARLLLATREILEPKREPEPMPLCSFCGDNPGAGHLIVGGSGAICRACSGLVADSFAKKR